MKQLIIFSFIFIALETQFMQLADLKVNNETAYENCIGDDKVYIKARQLECLLLKHITTVVRVEK